VHHTSCSDKDFEQILQPPRFLLLPPNQVYDSIHSRFYMPISTLGLFSFSRTRRTTKDHSTLPNSETAILPSLANYESSTTPFNGKGKAADTRWSNIMGHSTSLERQTSPIASTSSYSPSSPPSTSRDTPIRPRSISKRRYNLPTESQLQAEGCPYCPDEENSASDGTSRSKKRTVGTRLNGQDGVRRSSDDSIESLQGLGNGKTGSNRAPLFDDVDDLESAGVNGGGVDDQLSSSSSSSSEEDCEACSLFSYTSPTSSYTLGRSPSTRKSSLSTTATSDPLISPCSVPSVPILSFGSPSHQRGHWLPGTPDKIPAPSAQSQFAPPLPDLPAPLPLSTSPEKQGSSLRRATSLSFTSKPSLLSKSLRSLASLPNLTLPNLLPQLPRPDIYLANSDSPFLKSGWGAKERRRVLDSEPSWDADEARGLLSRRNKLAHSGFAEMGAPVDEAEAILYAATMGLSPDADLALSDFSSPPPPVSPPSLSPPPSPTLVAPVALAPAIAPPTPPLPSPPSQRFISNTRHLLMLSIEFSMMRADKISSPLRPRAVIVRSGSPPRGVGHSGLRKEITC